MTGPRTRAVAGVEMLGAFIGTRVRVTVTVNRGRPGRPDLDQLTGIVEGLAVRLSGRGVELVDVVFHEDGAPTWTVFSPTRVVAAEAATPGPVEST